MPFYYFSALKKFFHISFSKGKDKNEKSKDVFYKVTPFISKLKQKFQNLYKIHQNIAIDESMISFKGKNPHKFYLPRKPKKWGFKLHCLCESSTGYCYNLSLESNSESRSQSINDYKKDLIQSLTKELPEGHILHTDSWYSSLEAFKILSKQKIASNGTYRICNLPKDLEIEKGSDFSFVKQFIEQEEIEQNMSIICSSNKGVNLIKWEDKRTVYFLSTIYGNQEVLKTKRNMLLPECAKEYIENMGGVDLMDKLISSYQYPHSHHKWWRRVFIHFLEISLVNAWIAFNESQKNKNLFQNQVTQIQFRESIVEKLFSSYQIRQFQNKFVRSYHEASINIDGTHFISLNSLHSIIFMERNLKTKRISYGKCFVCKKYSQYKCAECQIPLCPECHHQYHIQNKIY